MKNSINSIAYLNQDYFVACLDGNKIQVWSINPTQQIDQINNIQCFLVSRIDDQRFLSGSSFQLIIYSFLDNKIDQISSPLNFQGLNSFQVINSQYVFASNNTAMRMYDINENTFEQFFCTNQNRGLFFDSDEDFLISPCDGIVTSKQIQNYRILILIIVEVWNKKEQTSDQKQYQKITQFQQQENILMIQAQLPLSNKVFLAFSSEGQIIQFQYKNQKLTQLKNMVSYQPITKFRAVGQKIVIINEQSLQIYNNHLALEEKIDQGFTGFDYLIYQENLITYDSKNQLYIIIPQNSFQWCDRLCLKCQVSDPSQCISCKLPNMIVNSNFQCVCQDGFYLDSNQVCQQCSPTCKTCSDHNTCLTCDDTQFRIYNSNTNLCDCKQSYYSLSSQPVCLKCPYYCKTCQFNNQQNQIKCLQCFQNPELNRSITGNCQCLLGYFDGGTNLQCSFNNTNFRLLNPSKLSCNPGTYEDVVNKICKNCPTKCKECQKQGLKLFCTACDTNGTFRLNDQTCSCQSGYYDAGQKQCKQCNSGCTTCDQQGQCQNSCSQNCISCNSPTVCTKCQPLTYLVNQQCQTQCNSNQHADNVQQICIDCPSFCNKCDLDPTKCQICASNYVLFNETCLTSCPDTYYKDSNSICQPCLQNCSQCDSSQICNVCKVGYSLYQSNQCLANCPDKFYSDSNNICQPCQQNCIQCNFSGVCSKCTDNFYLFQNQQCLQNCPQNYFHEDSSKTCQKCMNNCDTCSSSDTCSQCQQNYYLLNNSQCLSDCPQKFYKDSQKSICAECSSNCDQCSDSISCQICSSRFFLLNNLSCVQKCPDGYFENKSQRICNQCSTNFCQKCKQQNSCIVCENSYFLKENQCVTQCGQGYQIQNNSCIACKANNCLGCDKQVDQCSSCKDGFDLFKNECVMKCKQNQIRDQNGSCSTQNQFKLENKKNNQILMTFQSKPNLEEVKKNLQVNILNLQSQFDYSVDIQDDLTLIITINCSKKLDTKQTVTISINDNNNQFATPYQQIDVQIIQKKQDENPAATKSFETATQAVSSATMAAIFPLALSGNFWMISSILDISQIIYMTSFIQFELTSTLDTFLSSQKDFKIPFPNFFEYINDYEEIYYDTPPQIKEKDIQGFYLSNMEIYLEIKEIYIKYKTNKMKKLTIVPFDENKVNEKSEKQILEDQKLFSKQIKENEISMQDQNIGLDLSPRKLDNRQNISNLLDQYQTQITYDLSTPVKRVLRNKRSIKLMEAKTQVPENNNITWLITPTQKVAEANNIKCFQVSRIDAVANSDTDMRIYDLNSQSYQSFFYLFGFNPNRGLFFNPNDDIMISSTQGQITIWDKKQKTLILGYFQGVSFFSNSDPIQMVQAQLPLSQKMFLASSKNYIYRQQYQDNQINQLQTYKLSSNPLIKFRTVGQKVVIIDQNSLKILSSNLDQDENVNQSFAGFDSLRYQDNLILYDSQNNVYMLKPANPLLWCNNLCSTCQESDANICLSCKQANMILNSNSQCVCKDGFYMDSNQMCQQCSTTCKTCSDQSTCLTCDDTQFRVYNNNTKQCDCQQSYYSLNSQPTCIKCPYFCQKCQLDNQLNSIQCQQCFQNPALNRSITGNCQCLPGYFDDGTNLQCAQCNYTCQECNNSSQCTICDSTKNRYLNSSSQCVCQSGYYDDGTNQLCQKCPYNCQECQKQGAKIVCTACNMNGTFRQNDQLCSCSNGYYDAGQLICKQCNNGCQTCDSSGQCQAHCPQNCIFCNSSNTCTKCKPLTYLVNQQCQNQCNSNQYADDTQQICVNCPNFCIKCNLDPTICQQCLSDYVLYQNKCLLQCPDGSYKDSNNICQPCPQNCFQCDSNGTCKKCQDGFNLYQNKQCLANCPDGNYNDANNICQPCQDNCIKCNYTGICNQCSDSFYLHQNQQCLKNCPINYYPDDSSKSCMKCMKNCEQCSSYNLCNQCVQNYYLLNGSQCLSDCPEKYFQDSTKSFCTPCFLNCNQCNDSSSCKVCSNGFYLLDGLSCVQDCPNGTFQNISQGICQLCTTNFCQKCNQQNKCTECKNNYFLKESECVQKCGSGFQTQNNTCIACQAKNCQLCDKQIDQCSSCFDGFELIKNDCFVKCQANQLRDENGICFEQNQFKLESKSNNQIQMIFKYKPNFEDVKKELQIQIPGLQGQFDYNVDIQDNYTLVININTSKKLDIKQTVTISINDNNKKLFINPLQSIDIQIIQKKQDENPAASKSFETATQAVSTATIAAIFPLALSGNFWMISSILDISQIIYMTSFIQFYMTSTLDVFLSSQKNFKIPFPNFFEYINHYEEIVYDTPSQINDKDIQGFYLSNMGDTISLFAIIFSAYLILKFLVHISTRFQKVYNVLIKLQDKLFPTTLIADLLWVVYQDMSFSVVLQLITLNIAKYAVEILNYFIFSVSFFGILLPLYLTFIIFSGSNKEIKEHLTKDQQFNYYQILLYFRKFFYTVVIGGLQTSPLAQILLITIFHLILLLITIKLKPFKVTLLNIKEGIQSLSFFICHILVLVLYLLDESDSLGSKIICWVILSIFSLIIVFEVILCFREIYIAIKEVYTKYKKNKKKKLTIVPYHEKEVNEKQEQQREERKESVKNMESQNDIQDQNIGLDLSPTKLDSRQFIQDQNIGLDLSPTKLDSRQFISTDQNQANTPISPIRRRRLRNERFIKDMEAKTQVPDNQNISTMLRIYKSGSDLSEGQTFRDFRVAQTQRSSLFLLEDQNSKSNNNSIIQSKKEFQETNTNKS
ncbi:hypothetical protein ABPG73_000581 [Tetrahymena malaccensis]